MAGMDKVAIELTIEELKELIGVLQFNISEETKILNEASKDPSSGAFDRFLASINRKTELYVKLQKALNNRHLK